MDRDLKHRHRQRYHGRFEHQADSNGALVTTNRFKGKIDDLLGMRMETIPEEDIFEPVPLTYQLTSVETTLRENEFDAATPSCRRRAAAKEYLQNQIREAKHFLGVLGKLQDSYRIEADFRPRLDEIYGAFALFITTPVGQYPRPSWAQLCRMEEEVTTHVEQRLASDMTQL